MKIKQLIIEDFQSIRSLTLDFDERGVYYFRGANNVGKSSILKAINCLFFNANNQLYKSYIRDDAHSFYIKMTDFNHNYVELSRGVEDYYKWSINGQYGEFNRTSGQVPSILTNYFNLYFDEKSKECANIRLPRAILLGVDTTAGQNNDLLQYALNSELFTLGYKDADKRRNAVNKEIKLLDGYRENVVEKIEVIDIHGHEARVEELNNYKSTLERAYTEYQALLELPAIISEVGQLIKQQKAYTKVIDDYNTLADAFQSYPLLNEVLDLELTVEAMTDTLRQTDDIDEIQDTHQKNRTILDEIDVLNATIEIVEQESSLTDTLETLTTELSTLEEELVALQDELGVCPLCQTPFKAGENNWHTH